MMSQLSKRSRKFYLAPIRFPRSRGGDELAESAQAAGVDFTLFKDLPSAFEAARRKCSPNELVLGTGSFYLVGEILRHLGGLPPPPPEGRIDDRV
jgi:folylpolyglutamate synthase/dihydropteroate synthase